MAEVSRSDICVIIPTFSVKNELRRCVTSLKQQDRRLKATIIVIDNGSGVETKKIIDSIRHNVVVLQASKNRGFAGGVNIGIRYALKEGFTYVALLNDDAVADKQWLRHLHSALLKNKDAGIATGKMLDRSAQAIDSTGECYSLWGIAFPRGRNEADTGQYDTPQSVFGASGGASLYRTELFQHIGVFDEDFFAYFEDVDLSFRAQLAGWKVRYVPEAVVYHQGGATSGKIKGFATYHTFKNLPLLLWKNVPLSLLPTILPRFALYYSAILISSTVQGRGWWVINGSVMATVLFPKKLVERRRIQQGRAVKSSYIRGLLYSGLPPNAQKVRQLRAWFLRK